MYTYIMERDVKRTQIYLTARQTHALDEEARKTGRTRSQLIREAIDARYFGGGDPEQAAAALRRAAGAWRGRRESGAAYVERKRRGRLARLHR
jgi:predicted DNA-binding protein